MIVLQDGEFFKEIPDLNYKVTTVTTGDSMEPNHINQFVYAIRSIESRIGDYHRDVVTKCAHCGQWAAVKTACVSCGAPVDPPKTLL